MKIVLCSSEVVPFAKTGGLADVAGALPAALEKLGQEVIIVMPRYKGIDDSKFKIQRLKEDISYSVIGENINPVRNAEPINMQNKISNGVKVYFIEKDDYFNRDGLYTDKNGDHKDNLDRFSYYCKRTLELLKEINFKPDIIHCNEWQTCLIPVYLKKLYAKEPFYRNIKTILTIHNIGYQGLFSKEEFSKLGLNRSLSNMKELELYGKINLLKGGMVFSDIINTVSTTYSKEIQTKEFGFGLEGILAERKKSVFGILNGLDYSLWDPRDDKFIIKKYSAKNIDDKYKNKEDLQRICDLPVERQMPLFGIVSRLAEQKGFDILAKALEDICKLNLQMVILGTGEARYHSILENIAKKYPKVISVHLKFDNALAHKIYAGSDIFVMPSRYEPCGLGQMISFKYGTVPLVFKTGGLADTVNQDNGFIFDKYNKNDLAKTFEEAIKAFENKDKWMALRLKGMQYNFSWEESAKRYIKLYEKASSL